DLCGPGAAAQGVAARPPGGLSFRRRDGLRYSAPMRRPDGPQRMILGSSASRRPSPMKLMQRTVATTASPGKVIHHQLPCTSTPCAPSRVDPQVEVGGGMPNLRKLTNVSRTTL